MALDSKLNLADIGTLRAAVYNLKAGKATLATCQRSHVRHGHGLTMRLKIDRFTVILDAFPDLARSNLMK